MGIKLAHAIQPKTRTTKVKLLLQNPDTKEWYEEETPIEYFSDTIENYRERFKGNNIAEDDAASALARRINSFPEIVDDDNKPVEVTAEFLSTIHATNLKRISEAIQLDMSPEKKSLKES